MCKRFGYPRPEIDVPEIDVILRANYPMDCDTCASEAIT